MSEADRFARAVDEAHSRHRRKLPDAPVVVAVPSFVYVVLSENLDDSEIESVHATEQGAEQACQQLAKQRYGSCWVELHEVLS